MPLRADIVIQYAYDTIAASALHITPRVSYDFHAARGTFHADTCHVDATPPCAVLMLLRHVYATLRPGAAADAPGYFAAPPPQMSLLMRMLAFFFFFFFFRCAIRAYAMRRVMSQINITLLMLMLYLTLTARLFRHLRRLLRCLHVSPYLRCSTLTAERLVRRCRYDIFRFFRCRFSAAIGASPAALRADAIFAAAAMRLS